VRVAELRDWIESGAYERIVAGEYQRRDEKDTRPYRQDLAEAMKGYKDAARELFDEVDAAVDRLRSKIGDAFRTRSS
jgi:hypothetical protein